MSECPALYFLGPPKMELNTAPILTDLCKRLAVLAYREVNDLVRRRD